MSHELRVPLTSIMAYSEVLGTLELDEKRRDVAARSISIAATHLLSIVDDALDLATIEVGVVAVDLRPVRLSMVVAEVMDMLSPLAGRRSVTLTGAEISPAMRVVADARRLRQALLNVVSDAVKYNQPGGAVRIEVDKTPSRVQVRVTGRGWRHFARHPQSSVQRVLVLA